MPLALRLPRKGSVTVQTHWMTRAARWTAPLLILVIAACGGAADPAEEASDNTRVAAAVDRPTLTVEPADVTVAKGERAGFRVQARGSGPLKYQWRRNGKAIPNATADSYVAPRAGPGDDGDVFSVTVSNPGGEVTSRGARLAVGGPLSPLAQRAWSAGAKLDVKDRSVVLARSAIDDAGIVVSVFATWEGGDKYAIMAARAVRGSGGKPPRWTKPIVLDAEALLVSDRLVLAVSPNGNAVALWTHSKVTDEQCPRGCVRYAASRYLVADDAWEPPLLLDPMFMANSLQARVNDAGDTVVSYDVFDISAGTDRTVVAWRAAEASAYQSKVLTHRSSLPDVQVALDEGGRITAAGTAIQNATADIVAYRGDVIRGLGEMEIVDERGDQAFPLERLVASRKGQVAITWWQGNGVSLSRHVAVATKPGKPFIVSDLGPFGSPLPGGSALAAPDSGNFVFHDFQTCTQRRWSGKQWSGRLALPKTCAPVNQSQVVGLSRNGNYWLVGYETPLNGAWASYDAGRNAMIDTLGGPTPGPDYLLGFQTRDLGLGPAVLPLLSPKGVGAYVVQAFYDVLPTPEQPAGDRRGVVNLWVLFLQ